MSVHRSDVIVIGAGVPGLAAAESLSGVGPSVRVLEARPALARQLGTTPRRLASLVRHVWMHDWSADPFARGAYSYPLVGGGDAAAGLSRPVQGTLFFAGEAANADGNNATVHGAIDSGERAARQVLARLG